MTKFNELLIKIQASFAGTLLQNFFCKMATSLPRFQCVNVDLQPLRCLIYPQLHFVLPFTIFQLDGGSTSINLGVYGAVRHHNSASFNGALTMQLYIECVNLQNMLATFLVEFSSLVVLLVIKYNDLGNKKGACFVFFKFVRHMNKLFSEPGAGDGCHNYWKNPSHFGDSHQNAYNVFGRYTQSNNLCYLVSIGRRINELLR